MAFLASRLAPKPYNLRSIRQAGAGIWTNDFTSLSLGFLIHPSRIIAESTPDWWDDSRSTALPRAWHRVGA